MNNGMQTQLNLPQMSPVNKILIIIAGSLFLIETVFLQVFKIKLAAYLGLIPPLFFSGFLHQIITYPFIGMGLMGIIFNCLIIWFIGCELERMWGRKRYITFLVFAAVGAAIIYIIVAMIFFGNSPALMLPFSGLAGVSNALLIAYAILYPDRQFIFMFLFPMKAKYFCFLLVGIQLYMGFTSPSGLMSWGHLGAMFCGFIYMWLVSSLKISGILNLNVAKRKKGRGKLKLVKNEEEKKNDGPKHWH